MKIDAVRLAAYVAKNGSAYDAMTPEARATGIPVPVVDEDGGATSVDLYCLDAPSLLEWIRSAEANQNEIVIFMLLGFGPEEYQKALQS